MKPVFCANNNRLYASITAAAKDLNLDPAQITRVAKGSIKHTEYYVFSYWDPAESASELRARLLYNVFKIKM